MTPIYKLADRSLEYISHCANNWKRIHGTGFETCLRIKEEGRASRVVVRYQPEAWWMVSTSSQLWVNYEGFQSKYAWKGFDPEQIFLSQDWGKSALYFEPAVICQVALQPNGAWRFVYAPKIVILWIWNAALRS